MESETRTERDIRDLRERVESLERVAHEPVDFTALVAERAEAVARLVEVDPHQFSKRPCSTCWTVSALLGRAFGCEARRT